MVYHHDIVTCSRQSLNIINNNIKPNHSTACFDDRKEVVMHGIINSNDIIHVLDSLELQAIINNNI